MVSLPPVVLDSSTVSGTQIWGLWDVLSEENRVLPLRDPAPGFWPLPHPSAPLRVRQEVGLKKQERKLSLSPTKNGLKILRRSRYCCGCAALRGSATSPNDDQHGEERRHHPPECRGKEVRKWGGGCLGSVGWW